FLQTGYVLNRTSALARFYALAREFIGRIENRIVEDVGDEVDLASVQRQRRRQHVQMRKRAHQQAALLTMTPDALADADIVAEEFLALLVLHIFDAHHEEASAHIANQRQIRQRREPFLEIGADLADPF